MRRQYPWYDSIWLGQYAAARQYLAEASPSKLPEFLAAIEPLRTRPDFQVHRLSHAVGDEVMNQVRQACRSLTPAAMELHEMKRFGRWVVHDHAFFTDLQRSITGLASEIAGEPLEPSYNFVSFYTRLGRCPVHMDAPTAKWTLDLCIDQSALWPILFSQVLPWPEDLSPVGDDWAEQIKQDPRNHFTSHTLEPGQAVFFSGSSQWHYRDVVPDARKEAFCDLVFFHFFPKGTAKILEPKNWAEMFSVPELAKIAE